MRFADRRQAGGLLGEAIGELGPIDPVVYALPRGGVPVGFEVSKALGCPLDLLVVRKLGVPFQPELAMGAIAEHGVIVRNGDVIRQAGISAEVFEAVLAIEQSELEKSLLAYRSGIPPVPAAGRTAVIVDDGLATGSTALAGISVLESMGAASVWLAVPVAPRGALGSLESRPDRVIALSLPRSFGSVGTWYRDFSQTSDDEVRSLLAESRLA